jgi:hypothetical protein
MKLLLENWREYLQEQKPKPSKQEWVNWLNQIKATPANVTNHTVGHGTKVFFTEFDDNLVGTNTAGHKKYSLDRLLGHMFANDKKLLKTNLGPEALNSKYLLTVVINPGKVAVLRIDDFKKWFNKNTPNVEQAILGFKNWLEAEGFNGIWWNQPDRVNNAGEAALISNSLQIFKGSDAEVTGVRDIQTGQVVWRKGQPLPK